MVLPSRSRGSPLVTLEGMARARRQSPPPLEANDQAVTGAITAAWAVALTVLLVLRERIPPDDRWWIWTCLAGLVMGLFGLWYVPRLKRSRARNAARRERAREPDRGLQPGSQLWSSDSKTVSSTETPGKSTRS
jgi:Protein of unknown function (DUF2530)